MPWMGRDRQVGAVPPTFPFRGYPARMGTSRLVLSPTFPIRGCPARMGTRSLLGLSSGVLVRMPCTSGDTQVGAGPNLSNQESTYTGVCTYRQEYSKAMPPATLSREEMLICTGRQIVAEVLPERAPSPGNHD